jgi:uncharacterized membrane protein
MGNFATLSIERDLRWLGGKGRKLLRKLKERPAYIVCIFMAIYTLYFSCYTILNHYTFHTYAYDLGYFMQPLWTTWHHGGLLYSSLVGFPCLGNHFQPILFFILPLYALFSRAETLLVLQSLALALGALPIYWIARDEVGSKAGVAFAGLYLLYPALHGVNCFDFHPVALAIPLLLFSFYMFERKRYGWGMAFALLAMMCKENVPLVVIFMGLYWLWKEREKVTNCLKRKSLPKEREVIFPACLVFIGIVWFSVAVFVVPPLLGGEGGGWFYSSHYGGFAFRIQNLFTDAGLKALFLLGLFAPLAFTSLLHPATLLIALPIFAQDLLAVDPGMYDIFNQHASLLIPWIFIASIYGVRWLLTLKRRAIYARLFYALLPLGLIVALLAGRSPVSLVYSVPHITPHHHLLEQVITLVPEDASIYAQNDIFPHICHRIHAYCNPWNPNIFAYGEVDYVLIDETTRWSILDRADEESLDRLEEEYGIFAQGDGIYLYEKGYEGDPILLTSSCHP